MTRRENQKFTQSEELFDGSASRLNILSRIPAGEAPSATSQTGWANVRVPEGYSKIAARPFPTRPPRRKAPMNVRPTYFAFSALAAALMLGGCHSNSNQPDNAQ